MKRHLAGCILVILTLMLPGLSRSGPRDPVPRMVLRETDHDFGNIMEGRDVEHTFRFFNHGGATLHIERVSVG